MEIRLFCVNNFDVSLKLYRFYTHSPVGGQWAYPMVIVLGWCILRDEELLDSFALTFHRRLYVWTPVEPIMPDWFDLLPLHLPCAYNNFYRYGLTRVAAKSDVFDGYNGVWNIEFYSYTVWVNLSRRLILLLNHARPPLILDDLPLSSAADQTGFGKDRVRSHMGCQGDPRPNITCPTDRMADYYTDV